MREPIPWVELQLQGDTSGRLWAAVAGDSHLRKSPGRVCEGITVSEIMDLKNSARARALRQELLSKGEREKATFSYA